MRNRLFFKVMSLLLTFMIFSFLQDRSDSAGKSNFHPLVPIMSIDSVKAGMRGIVRTVLNGAKVDSFPAIVESIVGNDGKPGKFILVRAVSDKVKAFGGIAAGMSGSPFFIDGKLVGAIGYGWELTDHNMGLVTPIEDMMRVWDYADMSSGDNLSYLRTNDEKYKIEFMNGKEAPSEGFIGAYPVSTPFVAWGMNERACDSLSQALSTNVISLQGGSSGRMSIAKGAQLEPGSAIAAMLAWGDVSVGAIGTLTALGADGRFIAFAHPLLQRGDVEYLFTNAYVHKIIPSVKSPFKLGNPIDMIGVLTIDRPEGVGGFIGSFPQAMSVEIRISDADLKRREDVRFQVVREPFLAREIIESALLDAIDDAWGRRGEGTAEVRMIIDGNGLDKPIERKNYFFSEKDIAKDSLDETKQILALILHNEFIEIYPVGIKIYMEVTSSPRIGYIQDVKIDKKEAAPGEEITAEVLLKPYRKPEIKKTIKMQIPDDAVSGSAKILIRAGGTEGGNSSEGNSNNAKVYLSLQDIIDEINIAECNNQIMMEIVPDTASDNSDEETAQDDEDMTPEEKKQEEERLAKYKKPFDTNYFISGYIEKKITIVDGDK